MALLPKLIQMAMSGFGRGGGGGGGYRGGGRPQLSPDQITADYQEKNMRAQLLKDYQRAMGGDFNPFDGIDDGFGAPPTFQDAIESMQQSKKGGKPLSGLLGN